MTVAAQHLGEYRLVGQRVLDDCDARHAKSPGTTRSVMPCADCFRE
jgi:hypothetical protein